MKRWQTVLICLVIGIITAAAAAAERPNIVLFVCDDLSPTLGCYGDTVARTPRLDELAAEGIRFTDVFATTASCSASRSVILSGMHNHANGHYGHAHAFHKFASYPNLKSLPVWMTEGGYRTAICGKFHVLPAEVYRFETTIGANPRNAVEMAEKCEPFIGEKSDKPFFLYMCTSDPHRGGGKIKTDPLKPDRFGNRDKGYPGVKKMTYDPAKIDVPGFLPDTPACQAELAQYYQSVSRIDQGVGRLIKVLKDAGVYDNTLIIFTSDHGIAMPGAKTTVYEAGLRVPFIVKPADNRKRGTVNPAMISFVDLTPSILDFAGATPKQMPSRNKFHGRSFKPILDEKNAEGWDEINASHTFHEITMYYPMRVVRGRQYKLIWNIAHGLPYPFATDLWAAETWQAQYRQGMDAPYGRRTVKQYIHRAKFELYDITRDPHEGTNLADDPDHAERLEEMKKRLKAFQKRTNDPWIMKWNYE